MCAYIRDYVPKHASSRVRVSEKMPGTETVIAVIITIIESFALREIARRKDDFFHFISSLKFRLILIFANRSDIYLSDTQE